MARFLLPLLLLSARVSAQSPLDACADQFINSNTANAPTLFNSPPTEPFGSNRHLCYRDDGVSFFALEYWPEEQAPRWAAYRIDPSHYGKDACNTYTKDDAACYVNEEAWTEATDCDDSNDPFHQDHMVSDGLGADDLLDTGHDRGQLAPGVAFSWHVCGYYQTFSMANISPRRAFLNGGVWRYLERQEFSWGFDEGPIFVVTGTVFNRFPSGDFDIFTSGALDAKEIYKKDDTLMSVLGRHHHNFANSYTGDLLKPMRDADPNALRNRVKVQDMKVPTGYFKVIYRPARDGEPDHAIGFFVPHSFENLNLIGDLVPNIESQEAFWAFVSRIDRIEEISGIAFPGIPDHLKSVWGDSFFTTRRTGRDIRSDSCGRGTPQGVLLGADRAERLSACRDRLP